MAIPQTFLDDPFLTIKDIMKIMNWKKSKAYEKARQMSRYKDEKQVLVRQSWLQKWIDEHMEEPSN